MVETAPVGALASLRRDAILEAVAFAAERLLLASSWRDAAEEVVARLGIAAEVSRAYVVEIHAREEEPVSTPPAEWCAPGVASHRGDPRSHAGAWDEAGFGRWVELMSRGEVVQGAVASFPESERTQLQARNIVSLVSFPVFLGDSLWGCIGFDDCESVRDWTGAELEALRAAASVLGAAVHRQRADEQARRADRRAQQLVERIPAVTYTDIPREGYVEMGFVSPQIEQILGYPAQRFLDDPQLWMGLIHPDDRARLRAIGAFDATDTSPFDHEYRMIAVDGRIVWVHDTSAAVLRPDGSVEYFLGFMTDITQRKQAEDQVRREQERYRALVEHIPAVVYAEAIVSNAEELYISPQVEHVFGYTPQEWTAAPGFWRARIHGDDLERVIAANDRANATGDPFLCDYRFLAADGGYRWVRDEAVRVIDETGGPLFWQGVLIDMTQQKEAETGLRQADERYRALVEHIPAVVYTESPDAEPAKFYISPQVREMFGYGPDEWAWTPNFWADRIHPDDRIATVRADERTSETLEPYAGEYRFRAKDGRWVWIHDEATFVRDDPAHEGFWQGFMLDITERKEAEERLREAELKFRTIVEQSQAIFYTQDIDPDDPATSTTSYVAPGNTDMLGYTLDEIEADPTLWRRIIHPDDRERVLAADAKSNVDGTDSFSMEYRMIGKGGRTVWVQDEGTLVRLAGTSPYWQGFLLDITQRKVTEEALRQSHAHVQLIVETALDAVVSMNADGIITGWNPQAEATFGWSRGQALGREMADTIVPEAFREAHRNGLRRYAATGEGTVLDRRIEVTALHRDGREFPVELSIASVRARNETVFSAFIRDISERKRAERELERALETERKAAQRLRSLDEMKNTFLQAVSHDLRTPLAAILGLAITLERGDVHLAEHDARDLARRIADNARRLDRLVINLLDLDRLARGIVAPQLHPTDVGALLRRILDESELVSDARIRTDIRSVVAPVDAAKVERIVENLLANTARHTPANATIWISVRPATDPDGVEIAVEDDGPGVSPDLRETIFEPFRQGPDAPQHSPGVGVGLTLVRRFAELHGGRAWVREREGGGASFRVFLPTAPPDGSTA